ncbi:endothelin-converting enzyme 1-like [Dermacentor variabilis]|uniref:endothelin-converting enzyme 1-like n=1 Tax=Dermacentor variabilis TaxID=34621 RepID=UPI003F5C0D8A
MEAKEEKQPEEDKPQREVAESEEVQQPREELILSASAVAVLVFEVTVIAVVVTYILITTPSRSPFVEFIEPCLNLSCFQLDLELHTSMNLSVDPCAHFYQYACGQWGDQHQGFTDQFDLLETKVSSLVKHRLMEEEAKLTAGGSSHATDQSAAHYLSCVDVYSKQGDTSSVIKEQVFSKLEEGFTDQTKKIPSSLQETLNLLVHLSLDWNLGILVDLMIAPFHSSAAQQQEAQDKIIMHIDYSDSVPLWKRHKEKFLTPEKLTRCFLDFSSLFSSGDGKDVDVAELVKVDVSLSTKWSLASSSPERKPKYIQIKDIPSTKLKSTDWLSALNGRLPQDAQLTEDSDLYVGDFGMFALTEEVLSEGELKLSYALVRFHVARLLAPFTSYKFMLSVLGNPPNDTAASQVVTRECVAAVDRLFPFAWPIFVFGANITGEKMKKVQALYVELKDKTKTALSWLSDDDRKAAEARLDSLIPIVGWPEKFNDPNELAKLYPQVQDKKAAFIKTYLTSIEALNGKRKADLAAGQGSTQPETEGDNLRSFEATAMYSLRRGSLYVSPAILFEPFFVQVSDAFTWGSLGHVLAHELWHAAFGDLTLGLSPATDVVVGATRFKKHACVSQVVQDAGSDAKTAAFSAPEDFADVAGLQTARSSFASSSDSSEAGAVGTAGFTPEQLFYIGSCFKWCAQNGDAHPLGSAANTKPYVRCNAPIMMTAGFAEAFECPVDSPMTKFQTAKRFCNESDSGDRPASQAIK